MEVVHKPVSGQIYTYACRGVGISQEKKLYQSEYETTDGWKGNTQWKSGTLSAASNGQWWTKVKAYYSHVCVRT